MTKTVTSPVVRFGGTVDLKDPVPLLAAVSWEDAQNECRQHVCPKGITLIQAAMSAEKKDRASKMDAFSAHFVECCNSDKKPHCREGLQGAAYHAKMIPAIRECVEAWNVPDFDLANPPGSPRDARAQFLDWLIREIETAYTDNGLAEQDPNA